MDSTDGTDGPDVTDGTYPSAKRQKIDAEWRQYEDQITMYHSKTHGMHCYHWSVVPDDVLAGIGWLTDFTEHMRLKGLYGKSAVYREFGIDVVAIDRPSVSRQSQIARADLIQAKHRISVDANDLGSFCTAVRMCVDSITHATETRAVLYHSNRLTPSGALCLKQLRAAVTDVMTVHVPFSIQPIQPIQSISSPNYSFQDHAVNAIIAWMSDDEWTVGTLDMPCGTGKTVVVLRTIREHLQSSKILVVTPTKMLADQWVSRLAEVGISVDCRLFHTQDRVADTGSTITVAVVNSLSLISHDVDLIVVDEAHMMIRDNPSANPSADTDSVDMDTDTEYTDTDSIDSDSMDSMDSIDTMDTMYTTGRQWLLDRIQSGAKTLLVSATPCRGYDDVYKYDRAQAIRDGSVCDYRVYQPIMDIMDAPFIDPDFSQRAELLATASERLGLRAVVVYITRAIDVQNVTRQIQMAMAKHGRPVWIDSITATTSTMDRARIIDRFDTDDTDDDDGKLRVLIGIRILDQGIDLVACDGIFIMHPSLSAGSWRRLWQRQGRAMRLDLRRPGKIAHVVLWGDTSAVQRMMRLIAQTDTELETRVSAFIINYSRQDRSHESDAVRALQAYVVGIRRVLTLDEKVDLFCQHAANAKPSRSQVIRSNDNEFKIGHFWHNIQANFTRSRKPHTTLDQANKVKILHACGDAWLREYINITEYKHQDVAEAVDLLCLHAASAKPIRTKDTSKWPIVNNLPWNMGRFWDNIQANFTRSRKPTTTLDQVAQNKILNSCGDAWLDAYIDDQESKKTAIITEYTHQSVAEAVNLFCLHAACTKPIMTKDMTKWPIVNNLPWNIGRFWDNIQANFTRARKPTTTLDRVAQNKILNSCGDTWLNAYIDDQESKKTASITEYKHQSVAEAVDLFCLHAASAKPIITKDKAKWPIVNNLPWNMGQFWVNVQANFTRSRKPPIHLDQSAQNKILSSCGDAWLNAYINNQN